MDHHVLHQELARVRYAEIIREARANYAPPPLPRRLPEPRRSRTIARLIARAAASTI